MFKRIVASISGLLLTGIMANVAVADDMSLTASSFQNPVSEVRIGIMAHDAYPVWLPTTPSHFRFNQIEDIGFDVLFKSPDLDAFRWIGAPRVNFGGTINFDNQESMAHLGLTWQTHLFDSPVFVEGTIGGAIHNGILTGTLGKMRPQGCRIGFYTAAGLGVDINENVTATLVYEHMSNADLCSANYGLSNVGLKVGWKFN